MKKYNEYKVSAQLLPYIKEILNRRKIHYEVHTDIDLSAPEDEADLLYVAGNFSGTYFHKVVVRASVEKVCKEQGLTGLYLARSEAKDDTTVRKLLEEYNTPIYQVIE